MAKVARAIDYAHQRGILHRDLQPGNILLDENGEPLVSDFGLAKWLTESSDLTRTLTAFGTPGYIAPEQAESAAGDLTPASDVYSLGAILFSLLAGRPPFVGANALSVIHQAAAQPAPKIRSLAPALDRDLETICARCLARDPKRRYQTAGALAEDLERWLEGRPILARPVYPPARLWRWSRRNPALAAAAAACFLLGATLLWMLPNQLGPRSVLPISEKSVAVLPFENLSTKKEDAVFTAGVQGGILAGLAKIADLKVISRTSVMRYEIGKPRNLKDIGRELGVAYVVEGGVQRKGARVRVIAELVDARTDTVLWAQTLDRELSDIFAIQSEIAQKIGARLGAKLSPQERAAISVPLTRNMEALESYTQGKALMEKILEIDPALVGKLRRAIELLEAATRIDPQFAVAYASLVEADLKLYVKTGSPGAIPAAKTALERARRLAPEAGATHLAEAMVLYWADKDSDHALAQLEVAARSLPNSAEILRLRGLVERRLGRWQESLRHFKRAIELDPRDPRLYDYAVRGAQYLRRYAEAEGIADAAIAMFPDEVDLFRALKGFGALVQADLKSARDQAEAIRDKAGWDIGLSFYLPFEERDYAEAERALAKAPDDKDTLIYTAMYEARLAVATNTVEQKRGSLLTAKARLDGDAMAFAVGTLSVLDAVLGNKADAIRAAEELVKHHPTTHDATNGRLDLHILALVYTLTGERDRALETIRILVSNAGEWSWPEYFKLDPSFDSLRGDPRFAQILAEGSKARELQR